MKEIAYAEKKDKKTAQNKTDQIDRHYNCLLVLRLYPFTVFFFMAVYKNLLYQRFDSRFSRCIYLLLDLFGFKEARDGAIAIFRIVGMAEVRVKQQGLYFFIPQRVFLVLVFLGVGIIGLQIL